MARNSLKLLTAGLITFALIGCEPNDSNNGATSPTIREPVDSIFPGASSVLITSAKFGRNFNGSITTGEPGWYRIQVQKDSVYRVICKGTIQPGSDTLADIKLTVLAQSSAAVIASVDIAGPNPSLKFKAPDSGYVRVRIDGGKSTSAGNYSLYTALDTDIYPMEPNDVMQTATAIKSDGVTVGLYISEGDVDWFVFRTRIGGVYDVNSAQKQLRFIRDSRGKIYTGSATGAISSWPWRFKATDTLAYVEISTVPGLNYYGQNRITVSEPVVDSFELDDSIRTATPLRTDSTVQTHTMEWLLGIDPESDNFKFDAQLGKLYKVSVKAPGAMHIRCWGVYDSSGRYNPPYLDLPASSSTPQSFTIIPNATGLYHFELQGAGELRSTYTYTIAMTESVVDSGPVDSIFPGASSELITSAKFGRNFNGSITTGEPGWYRIQVQKDSVYRVICKGTIQPGSDTLADIKLTVLAQSSSAVIASVDIAGPNPSLKFKAPDSGYVRVRIDGGKSTSAGNYSLYTALDTDLDPMEPNDVMQTATAIKSDGVSVGLYISEGDVDWFVFRTRIGGVYHVNGDRKELRLIRDSKGRIYTGSTTSGNESRPWRFEATDTLAYVEISTVPGLNYYGGNRITVSEPVVDSFELDDSISLATLLRTDSTVQTHTMEYFGFDPETDNFKFNAQLGKLYKVSVKTAGAMLARCWGVYDSTGRFDPPYVFLPASSSIPQSFTIIPNATGLYHFELQGRESNRPAFTYTIEMTEVNDSFEPDNGLSKAVELTRGGAALERVLSQNDTDWFKFKADSGTHYTVSFPTRTFNSLGTYFLTEDSFFVSSSQTTLTSDSGGTFDCLKSGTYYVKLVSPNMGSYSIALTSRTTVQPDGFESDNQQSTASTLVPDSSVAKHSLPIGDEDWTKIAVELDKTYNFRVRNTGDDSCYFNLYSAESATLTTENVSVNSDQTTSYSYTARRNTDIYVRVLGGSLGTTYELTVQRDPKGSL